MVLSELEEYYLRQQAEAGKAMVDIAEYLLERCDRVKEMHQPTQVGEETVCAVCASFDPGGGVPGGLALPYGTRVE
jgi:hypothetical protein